MAYKQLPVVGPFKGIWDATPRPNTPPEAFDDVVNFFCRKGRIQSRPKLSTFGSPADAKIVRNMVTYADVNNSWHTLVLTTHHAYHLTAGPTYNALTLPSPLTDISGTNYPFGVAPIMNRVYFSNGSKRIMYADGSSTIQYANVDIFHTFRFLTANAFHLIGAFATEPAPGEMGSAVYPKRVRWSKSGDPNNWTDFTSGCTDLLEVGDFITGLTTLQRNTYIFRSNGITAMYPTGVGTAPFTFEQMSYAAQGVGNKFPYSLASYGSMAAFVSADDIYILDGSSLSKIASNCKKRIFRDIEQASGDEICGYIVPRLALGFDFLSYWLSIPGVNYSWVYNFEEQNWVRFYSSSGRLTCLATVAVS